LIIFGALLSSDPGDIHRTIDSLVNDRIRVSIVGLAAQVAICRELCMKTNGGDDCEFLHHLVLPPWPSPVYADYRPNAATYGVALNESHFRELVIATTTPPVTRSAKMSASSLLMMGFPSRIVETQASLCACHSKLTKGGYLCSRCSSKVCSLPAECPACGLTLILSTHLARSYHHLFPLRNWLEVRWSDAGKSSHCFACQIPFPPVPDEHERVNTATATNAGIASAPITVMTAGAAATSVSSRYECSVCHNHFCIDCDVWSHEVVHNCPGCLSAPPPALPEHLSNGAAMMTNGSLVSGDEMELG
jgi:transcription initiation factor TFIIH subunit 2